MSTILSAIPFLHRCRSRKGYWAGRLMDIEFVVVGAAKLEIVIVVVGAAKLEIVIVEK